MNTSSLTVTGSSELITSIDKIRENLTSWDDSSSQSSKKKTDAQLVREVVKASQIKRLIEKGQAEPNFRKQVVTNFQSTVASCGLNIDRDEVKFLWEPQSSPELDKNPNSYQKLLQVHNSWAESIINLAGTSTNLRFKAWRERQIARCASQLGKQQPGHFPLSFELSKGCSVGCWFCGVAAPSLGDIFFYTPENAQLWRSILTLMKDVLGTAAGAGFGYCATDPLDNPDYEQFLCDFHDILGVFPQTTTAQPLKDPARTRYLLKLALERGCMLNRFSIISLQKLERLYQEFTPEELAFVGLVLQNPESGLLKSNSGRAREKSSHKTLKKQMFDESEAGTTACVTGFLLNMIDRTVKLISPCPANDRYPLGYRVYQEGTFTNVEDLRQFIEEAIEVHMPLTVQPEDRPKFRPDLHYKTFADGFQLSTRHLTLKFPHLKQLGELIRQGEMTVAEIANLLNLWGISTAHTYRSLNLLLTKGVLDDEPQSALSNNFQPQLVSPV